MNNYYYEDKPKSNCGVFGIYNHPKAAINVYYGLHSLQHRGQESAGIIDFQETEGKTKLNIHKDFGLVSEIFAKNDILNTIFHGDKAIGHNRYSTTGTSVSIKNIQPFAVNYRSGNIAISHNGNITNAYKLREELVNQGAIFQTTSDTEVFLHLVAKSREEDQIEQIKDSLNQIEGAFSFVILLDNKLIGARDPNGVRPLCIGKLEDSYIITSETCALDINSAKYVRDVKPGEIVIIDDDVVKSGTIKSVIYSSPKPKSQCIFEYIYFSRPDSRIFEDSVDKMRRKLGKVLAKNHPVQDKDGDKVIVISVPDSSNTAAIGYQNQLEKMDIPSKLEIGLIRSHYIGRTFIIPGQKNREVGVKIKFNTVRGVLENRTIVLIDDSIVRGTTAKQLVSLIKEANPKEIHIRISSAPIFYPCFYGMDFPSKEELLANKFVTDFPKLKDYLGVDSIEYMTIEEMTEAMVDKNANEFCTACFSGNYPIPIITDFNKEKYD